MNKKLLLMLIVFLNLAILPFFNQNTYAEWSYVELEEVSNDLWAVWGSSAMDVYAVGTLGINLHYDGNPEGDWITLSDISP